MKNQPVSAMKAQYVVAFDTSIGVSTIYIVEIQH